MHRMACGTAAALALVGTVACFSNPSQDLNNGDFHVVQATPVVGFTKIGDSLQLRLRLVNDANNGAVTSFTVSGVPAGISVRYDDKFRPYYLNGADTLTVPVDKDMQQYYVKGVSAGKFTFTVTATANPSAPAATVTINVEAKDLGNALNKTTGVNAGDTLTLTAPSGTVFSQTSAVTFTTGTAAIASRSADSTVIKLLAGPGLSGVATVTKVGIPGNPALGVLTLATANSVALVPSPTVAPTTISTASPAFGASMTVTLGGSLRFLGGSTISVGGRQGFILSVSADSSTATFVPIGGSTGTVSYTGVALSFLPSATLNLPGDKTATVGAATSDPNAGSIATASTVTLPALGSTMVLSDGGAATAGGPCALSAIQGDGCRYYKIVTTTVTTLALELRWDTGTTADMGAYLLNAAGTGTGSSGSADAFGAQAGGPETGSWTNLPAGTYYIAIVRFGATQPPYYHLGIKRTL